MKFFTPQTGKAGCIHVILDPMNLPEDRESRRKFGERLKTSPAFDSILELIEALLSENGCPWDRSRTVEDCPKYLESELGEVVDAINRGDNDNLAEEIGDLLFMVAFTAKLAEKEGRLGVKDVFTRILNKMVFRHPHVFGGDMDASSPDQVVDNWHELKKREKEGKELNS